jgi:hypothetical protein
LAETTTIGRSRVEPTIFEIDPSQIDQRAYHLELRRVACKTRREMFRNLWNKIARSLKSPQFVENRLAKEQQLKDTYLEKIENEAPTYIKGWIKSGGW